MARSANCSPVRGHGPYISTMFPASSRYSLSFWDTQCWLLESQDTEDRVLDVVLYAVPREQLEWIGEVNWRLLRGGRTVEVKRRPRRASVDGRLDGGLDLHQRHTGRVRGDVKGRKSRSVRSGDLESRAPPSENRRASEGQLDLVVAGFPGDVPLVGDKLRPPKQLSQTGHLLAHVAVVTGFVSCGS